MYSVSPMLRCVFASIWRRQHGRLCLRMFRYCHSSSLGDKQIFDKGRRDIYKRVIQGKLNTDCRCIPMKKKPLSLKAVLFDFDGTLTRPGALNFEAIRKALGCPHGLPILEFIESLPDTAEQARLLAQLDRFETEAAAGSVPNDGAEELIGWLRAQGLHVGIITRNSRRSVERALENFSGVTPADFDVLISRDDPASPKPSSHGILLAAQMLGVHAAEVLVVGDHLFDIEAGHKAGSPTAYLTNGVEAAGSPACGDYTVPTLDGLRPIVRLGLPLPSGKLPE